MSEVPVEQHPASEEEEGGEDELMRISNFEFRISNFHPPTRRRDG
jgi:hypothetical protein